MIRSADAVPPSFAYVNHYYPRTVGNENRGLLRFFSEAYSGLRAGTLLDVGTGPTPYHLISASRTVRRLIATDVSPGHLQELRNWKASPDAGRWDGYIRYTLRQERRPGRVSVDGVLRRARQMKRRLIVGAPFDVHDPMAAAALRARYGGPFEVVSSVFCIDSITSSPGEWWALLGRLRDLVRHSGCLVLVSLLGSRGYHVGDRVYPAVRLDRSGVIEALRAHRFDVDRAVTAEIQAMPYNRDSYRSLFCVAARRIG